MQHRILFGDGTSVDVEDVLLEVVRPAECLSAQSTGEGVPGSEATALVLGVSSERRPRSVPTSAHYALKTHLAAASAQGVLHRGVVGCKHTGRPFYIGVVPLCRTHKTSPLSYYLSCLASHKTHFQLRHGFILFSPSPLPLFYLFRQRRKSSNQACG